MRALFYLDGGTWTGAARAFAVAARGLAGRGWQVTYACCGGSVAARVRRMGGEVVELEGDAMWLSRTGDLRKAISGNFVEAVFVHSEREQLAAAAAIRISGRGAVIRRVAAGDKLTLGPVARNALRVASTGFVFTWPDQPAELPPDLDVLSAIVADVGVDADMEATPAEALAAARPDERRILCVFEPGARHRAANVLRAVAMLAPRHPELRVTLIGPGASDEGLRMHAAALGVNRIVRHVGDAEDVIAHAQGAHLGWVVADGDDGAFGALDLMAASVPVLMDRGSDASRYVADGITGVHLEPGEVAGTAASIALLLAREDERVAIGTAGRARVLREHGEAGMVDGFARAAEAARDRSKWRA
jgi:glycosyltransferase involved in cell wall biosynthesis